VSLTLSSERQKQLSPVFFAAIIVFPWHRTSWTTTATTTTKNSDQKHISSAACSFISLFFLQFLPLPSNPLYSVSHKPIRTNSTSAAQPQLAI
jgi:hypothetical protein